MFLLARRRIRLSEDQAQIPRVQQAQPPHVQQAQQAPQQPDWNTDEPCKLRLLQIVGAKLNTVERESLRIYIDQLEQEFNDKFMSLWSDITSNNIRLNLVTKSNKVFSITGQGWTEEKQM
jgi:hypothetical protein